MAEMRGPSLRGRETSHAHAALHGDATHAGEGGYGLNASRGIASCGLIFRFLRSCLVAVVAAVACARRQRGVASPPSKGELRNNFHPKLEFPTILVSRFRRQSRGIESGISFGSGRHRS